MRITNEQKQENRERIVMTAAAAFREKGFDGVGVADLMERAGFTHGGFYNHFHSKDDLIVEASARSFGETSERYAGLDATAAIELYISREHRDMRADGCPVAALGGDAARQQNETKVVFAAGIKNLLETFQKDMTKNQADNSAIRAQLISIFAQAVGAIVLSRACPDDSTLADEVLDICRDACRSIIENGRPEQ